MSLEQVVHRIATDSAFAASVKADAASAVHRAGIELNEGELEALKIALDEIEKNGPANIIWYESQLSEYLDQDQIQAIIWYESQLGSEAT
jgi:hypothetical protein